MGGINMTQENKELLLKDLCARLPYNVICKVEFRESGEYKSKNMFLSGIFTDEAYFTTESGSIYSNEYKPYLFPLSSMTDKEKLEYTKTQWVYQADYCAPEYFDGLESYDWLNKNHFDYRGLIEKGLAIDATGLDVY